jgi:hypothetical protein
MVERKKATKISKVRRFTCADILGDHPLKTHPFGRLLKADGESTESGVRHRMLSEYDGQRTAFVECMREILARHHVGPEALERDRQRREAMRRLGFEDAQSRMMRFPSNISTQKGNLAEIMLAEYLVAASKVSLPVYRLRYNPNVDQAMKGDDVLAFDLDSNPARIIVGESKFRTTSSKTAVTEIVDGLVRSHKGGIPASLQFVADRLFETGKADLGGRVLECTTLFALEKLRLDYVGLLMSDARSAERLKQHTANDLHRLAVISFSLDSPDSIVAPCYDGLEEQL